MPNTNTAPCIEQKLYMQIRLKCTVRQMDKHKSKYAPNHLRGTGAGGGGEQNNLFLKHCASNRFHPISQDQGSKVTD